MLNAYVQHCSWPHRQRQERTTWEYLRAEPVRAPAPFIVDGNRLLVEGAKNVCDAHRRNDLFRKIATGEST